MSDKKNGASKRKILCISALVILSLAAWTLAVSFYLNIRLFYLPTASMEPAIALGDSIAVNIRYYKTHKIQRGDIVAFYPPSDGAKTYLKRCVAIEGDKFSIKNGCIYINDAQVPEKYALGETNYRGFAVKLLEGVVPPNCIITLGDNRENSLDSRFYGYVSADRIVGKAVLIYKSNDISRIGTKL